MTVSLGLGMLLSISIENFILVDKAQLDFCHNFNVITGETGAGKSIILDALQIILGGRISSKLLRQPDKAAIISAEFKPNISCSAMLEVSGFTNLETILIRRIIHPDGKSRSFLNDISVTPSLLQQLGTCLIEMFGQRDQHSLLSPAAHLEALDAFLQLEGSSDRLTKLYHQWQHYQAQFLLARSNAISCAEGNDYLRYAIEELEQICYVSHEEEQLAHKRTELIELSKMKESLQEAVECIDNDNLLPQIYRAQRALSKHSSSVIVQTLDRALIELEEAQVQLRSMMQASLEIEDGELEHVEERLETIKNLAKKHGIIPSALPQLLHDMKSKLSATDDMKDELVILEEKTASTECEYRQLAGYISQQRNENAYKLSDAVQRQMNDLHMPSARFLVRVETIPQEATARGIDRVFFEIATNYGSKPGPLHKIASGGETSRIMLALKVALSDAKGVSTIIFDEVDVGIGGATASSIGKKLAELASNKQILSITHQPQVAAYADGHHYVHKSADEGITSSSITPLDQQQKVMEIARMLSGTEISEQAREAAKCLMNQR